MKRIFSLILLCTLTVSLSSCGSTGFAKIAGYSSQVYSPAEIEAAIDVVTSNFKKNWEFCTLLELSYIGDDKLADYQDWADRNNADDVIVFLSDFYISFFANSPTMNNGSEYEGWMWILVRTRGGEWQLVDWGY